MIAIGSYFVIIVSVMGMMHDSTYLTEKEKDKFLQTILDQHNIYREAHGSKKLKFDSYSAYWASGHNSFKNNFDFLPRPGVNSFSIELSKISKLDNEFAKKIVVDWYKTGKEYKYGIEPTSNTADPFTQIVWRSSECIGIEMKNIKDKFYLNVYYFPFGNEVGQYNENVKSPINTV